MTADPIRTPVPLRATYRLQLNPDFTLDDAAQVIPYLRDLGISHVYCSPYLQAAPGSTHGYDVVDPHRVNEELGGAEAHARFVQALMQAGLGQVLDIVPNHMAISGAENPWWRDVLEHGPSSRYASYFDVDWDPPETRHSNAVLVPILGDHYGRILEAGEIQLEFQDGVFLVSYHEHRLPVDPTSLSLVLGRAAASNYSNRLAFLADEFARLPHPPAADRASAYRRSRDQAVLKEMLLELCKKDPQVSRAVEEAIQSINQDADALDAFLQEQNYRLAFWRIAKRELGYRRFFDINTLIGLRVEDPQVYSDSHALVVSWLAGGLLHGLRIDHPDGLKDPYEYLQRLRKEQPGMWVVVEKILEAGETLPSDWPVDGTTGYDFLNRVNGLFVDPRGEEPLTGLFTSFTGQSADYDELVYDKKHQVMDVVLGSDVNRLAALFLQVTENNRRYRDYSRNSLRETLVEVAACMPVYRTYIRPEEGEVSPTDARIIEQAVQTAKQRRPDLDPDLFDFLHDLFLLRVGGPVETELVERFQQFTGPVMAKGVEDTTFYVFNRLVSLNEVGGDPRRFGCSVKDFHHACQETQHSWPRSMLATSTHDTKRSEDVRARLNVLSEIPDRWESVVKRWAEQNERYRQDGMPARDDEYLLYQTLVGAWPLSEERLLRYMEKAAREAKTHTSWRNVNEAYESALAGFVKAILADKEFTAQVQGFVAELVAPGRTNSLAQALLKLTTPGVPDIYQGSELWNLTLVDPDNRQPVDYEQRRRLLAELDGLTPEQIWARADEGLPKLWVTRQALALRQRCPQAFDESGVYHPLQVSGEHALAFQRGEQVVVVVPRLAGGAGAAWQGETVALPSGGWRNLLTGDDLEGGSLSLQDLFRRFPVCLLERAEGQA